MVDAKALIIASFIAMVVSGVAGVLYYYSSLEPFRLIAHYDSPGPVLDKVSYIEYTVEDLEGNRYTARVYNDPASRTGRAELYSGDGTLLYTFHYTYSDTGLVEAWKEYPNGTRVEFTGGLIVLAEDAFFTGVNYTIAEGNATIAAFDPFPGAAPVFLPQYLADYLQVDWGLLASLIKHRAAQPSTLMDLSIVNGRVVYNGEEVDAVIIRMQPRVLNPPNKWAAATYLLGVVVDDNAGLPVTATWSIEVALGGQDYRLSYNVTAIEFSP